MYRLLTYPNKNKATPIFYVQMKGNNSGQPLREPIQNCVAVYSEKPFLFEVVYLLFRGRKFHQHLKGSVVPFVRIADVKEVINDGLQFYKPEKMKLLNQINALDSIIKQNHEKIKLLKQMQILHCSQFFK